MLSYRNYFRFLFFRLMSLGLITCTWHQTVQAQINSNDERSVYQYAVSVGSKQAYLWIPPACKQIKGVIISFSNLLERNWLEDPIIRKMAAKDNLAIILAEPSKDGVTPDLKLQEQQAFLKMLKDLGAESGYPEIEFAPFIPIDHSVYGIFTWNLAAWLPDRVIAGIPVKTFSFPPSLTFKDIPFCYIIGETDEWPPIKDGRLWSRDFVWPEIRQSAVMLRKADDHNLIGVVTDPGGGHLDWSDKLTAFMALYIDKACRYRLPVGNSSDGPVVLKKISPESGWLTDTGGLHPDRFKPASYQHYTGDRKNAYWFFDRETAQAAMNFAGDRNFRRRQMLSFLQRDTLLPISKTAFVSLQFLPEADGVTFKVKGGFLPAIPSQFTGAGNSLGHVNGAIKFRVITGPAIQTNPGEFQIVFNRSIPGGDVWLQEEQAGDGEYQHAVQPAQMKLPIKLTDGKSQTITFPKIADQAIDAKQIILTATSSSGLPVRYFVVSGPAVVNGSTLRFTKIPVKSRYPVKVTVTAYQWGRTIAPLYQSAEMVTQSFWITPPK